jgi:hypothetical protein
VRRDSRRLLPCAVAEDDFERVSGGSVHLARGLGRERVRDDLRHERRHEAELGRARVDEEISRLQRRDRLLERRDRLTHHLREDVGRDRIAEHRRGLKRCAIGCDETRHA